MSTVTNEMQPIGGKMRSLCIKEKAMQTAFNAGKPQDTSNRG
jgi:hypothetical protein